MMKRIIEMTRNPKPETRNYELTRNPTTRKRVPRTRNFSRERGQSMIELAIMLPLILLLMVGGIEVGFAFHNWHLVAEAARAGVRAAARGETDAHAVDIAIDNLEQLRYTRFFDGRVEGITIDPPEDSTDRIVGNEVSAMVDYKVALNIPFWRSTWYLDMPQRAVMRIESPVRDDDDDDDVDWGGADLIPLSVLPNTFLVGTKYTLKLGGGGGAHGNYHALALGGTGAANYEDKLKHGYDGDLRIGDMVTTEPGNMSGPTNDGIDYRMSGHEDETYTTYQPHSSRVVTVPIIDHLPQGRDEVTILGFSKFFLEEVGGQGNNCYVTATYLGDVGNGHD
ncbi:MAG: TadE/TadG family type IV pilus assembly protein [bacterium]|nr:TadE/TadG family type IV pilus assembly protein [bacterium]